MGTDEGTSTARRRTACRICAVGCGTIVDVMSGATGDRVIRVAGDPDDPVSQGYTCSKGRAGPEFHHHADRLDRPLVRTGGGLVAATWDAALDDIAARVRAILADHGGRAVASYLGTGGPLDPSGFAMAEGFFRSIGTDQKYSALSIDCPSKFLIPQLVSGVQLAFQPDIDHTDVLLAVGVNTVVSHGHGLMTPNPLVRLRQLRARGGRLIVLDPRRTETAAHADLHLHLRPGTDHVVLAAAVREALRGGADTQFLEDCADPSSVERLRAFVEPFDAEHAAAVAGLDATEVRRFVELTTRGRLGIETGTGVSMSASANLTEWMAWALAAVTGSLDRAGGCTFNPGFLRPLEDALPGGRGDLGPRPASRPDLPRVVNGEMPCAALADEIEAGEVRALFVRVGNPASTFPDNRRVRAALELLDLLVVIDARPTETTELATHVLPMADHFERSDLLTGYLQAKPFMRWAPAVVDPVGERRSQWWMFAELTRRCGFPLFGSERRDRVLAGATRDDAVIAETITHGARHGWEEILAAPYGVVDESLAPGWLLPGRLGRPLDLAPVELTGSMVPFGRRPGAPGGAAGDEPPALVLVNRRTASRYNSLDAVAGRRVRPARPTLLMHPDDAADRRLTTGEAATVSTASGSCVVEVEVTDAIRRGVVSLPHAWPDADVNRLTSGRRVDPLSAMPEFSGFAVTVERRPSLAQT